MHPFVKLTFIPCITSIFNLNVFLKQKIAPVIGRGFILKANNFLLDY